MFNEKIEEIKQDAIDSLLETIKFESVSIESEDKEAPFGIECKKALDYVLELGNNMGFRTKNIDGYCGYIEFGEGEEMVGIIGHLDVVPAQKEDGWNTDPFKPEIIDNRIYGRGAIDDKGPVMASLYAMKVVSENCKLNKRVRLILGLNEEKDWKCITRYKLTEEMPTLGFSPDADFPCIYAEKGIYTTKVSFDLDLGDGVKIIEVDCANNAINVVPKYASITIECETEEARNRFLNLDELNTIILDDKKLKIEAFGKSAHAAYPEQGYNAISRLLNKLPENENIKKLRDNGFFEIFSPKYLGNNSTTDESGKLTSNIGQIGFEDGQIYLVINYRVPVKTSLDYVKNQLEGFKSIIPEFKVEVVGSTPKLFVPKDSYLVKTLIKIYENEINTQAEPIATGGGTYARAFKNCVAFGSIFPWEEETYHQANEYIDINSFTMAMKIYANAIYELGK